MHVVLPSWIYRQILISLRCLNLHNAPLAIKKKKKKKEVKRSFQSSWFANRTWLHYDEANDLAHCHVCMLLTETESWTVRILIRRSYSMGFPAGKTVFKNTTLPGAIVIRWGVEIVVFSMFVLSNAQTKQLSGIFLPTYLQNWLNLYS